MNPPTVGHGKLLDKLASEAGKNPYKIYLSQSTDPSKNPLSYSDKIKHVRKMFPKHARSIIIDKNVKTAIEAITSLYNQGFHNVVMVVGQDRVREFEILLNKYNGVKARHGFYNFKMIKVVSAGERDPDAEGVEGMSASKMRSFASNNDFTSFAQGLPTQMSNKDARKLFNDVRKGMGLSEEHRFKNHIALKPVSETREAFVQGQLYQIGDSVIIKESDQLATIVMLGSNYVIVEMSDNTRVRKWLDAVELVESDNQPEWGTDASTRKAKKITPGQCVDEEKDTHVTKDGRTVQKGLWYNINQRRKKGLPPKKPGQEGYPKTLNIEQADMERAREIIARDKQISSDKIAKEKEKVKVKHDRMLDRARRAVMLRKNRGTRP